MQPFLSSVPWLVGPGSENGASPETAALNRKLEEEKPGPDRRSKPMAVGSIQAPKISVAPKKGITSFRSKDRDKEAGQAKLGGSGDSFSK